MTRHCQNLSYDPNWPKIYSEEAAKIQKILGENCLQIEHFGSTSIPNLSAKPKIDIFAVVKDLADINTQGLLTQLGFITRECLVHQGKYFTKHAPYHIHLHVFQQGDSMITRNLLFRDWLRTHPDDCERYARLKHELSEKYQDGMAYCHAKTEFITQIIEKASHSCT